MRAACLLDNHSELVICDVELDVPGDHEVVVQVSAVGLCHSDLHVIDGTLVRPRPLVIGHEACGIVTAIGSDVSLVEVGNRLVTCLVMGCDGCVRSQDRRCFTDHRH